MAGLVCSGISHGLLTPLDALKCTVQADNKAWSLRTAYQSLSLRDLFRGWRPTVVGYGLHGLTKFGLYDGFKHQISVFLGVENSKRYRDIVYLASSASAEALACVALCPLENQKLKAQVRVHPPSMTSPWVGLSALCARQIPFSIVKFMSFERIAESIYAMSPKAKSDMTTPEHLAVVLTTGWVTGVFCGAVSHPADVIVTRINLMNLEGSVMTKTRLIVDEIGVRGLMKGFVPRVVMIGCLTASQWLLYGLYKSAVGLPTAGL
jgi:solute carrier family 25 (mitochondrial phosphate transporter), member 3